MWEGWEGGKEGMEGGKEAGSKGRKEGGKEGEGSKVERKERWKEGG